MENRYPKHGLTGKRQEQVFTLLLQRQHSCCAICGRHVSQLYRRGYARNNLHYRLYLDHCHSTGMIRGLLCNGCNLELSYLERPGAPMTPEQQQGFHEWHARYLPAITDYMRVERWFPRKDILFLLQERGQA